VVTTTLQPLLAAAVQQARDDSLSGMSWGGCARAEQRARTGACQPARGMNVRAKAFSSSPPPRSLPVAITASGGPSFEEALLDRALAVRVVDPSMGAGSFLIEAVDFITKTLLQHRDVWALAGGLPNPSAGV
jgi:hypothetical protein